MKKNNKISNCCGASIIDESIDVCSDCKEHCELITQEEIDFDEAMNTQGKGATYNGKFVENCNSCQWHIEGNDKSRDMMCRNCSLAYTSNWTKKEYHGN